MSYRQKDNPVFISFHDDRGLEPLLTKERWEVGLCCHHPIVMPLTPILDPSDVVSLGLRNCRTLT
jgi:hypothetical protein